VDLKNLYRLSPVEKLELVVTQAWEVFKSKFLNGKYSISTEAPFQHHFANNLRVIGETFCFSKSETFLIDLETREEDLGGKRKYIDITLGFYDDGQPVAKAAIELKFKKRLQGADDFARIDSYSDIESLERCEERGYDLAYFFMISDFDIYTRESRPGTTGYIFSMRDGYTAPANKIFTNPHCKGRRDIEVTFKREHTFNWEIYNSNCFLSLPVFVRQTKRKFNYM
jgi:hypothetical protein